MPSQHGPVVGSLDGAGLVTAGGEVGAPGEPAAVETHISVLVFTGERVLKLRKPVRFGFLDFSDREARAEDCRREVVLNRRLAPDVYLGVADLVLDGRPVDHAVVMRRLPTSRRLSVLLGNPSAARPCVRQVARLLAGFHARTARSKLIDAAATVDALTAGWNANFREVAPFVGDVLHAPTDAAIVEMVERYLAGRGALVQDRIDRGQICDGHGDLQAADVFCLDDGPRILDCIEFDDRLRYADVAADLAFLLMDLERLGAPALAGALRSDYEELAGTTLPASLLHHYVAARAYVRAKVGCLRAAQGDAAAADGARAVHRLAAEHLRAATVRLVLVGGLPGTGKSVLAAGLGDVLDAVVLRTDEVRRDLDGGTGGAVDGGPAGGDGGYGVGRYGPRSTEATYRTVLDRAERTLAMGRSVVVDASFVDERWRQLARSVATRTASALGEIELHVDPALAASRIERRRRRGDLVSEATPAVAASMAAVADPWPSAMPIDASGTPQRTLDLAVRALEVLVPAPWH